MYKSKLQELCQKKSWALPEYSVAKQGLDHSPRFTATVTVNGITFTPQFPVGSSKQSQNDAAKLAFDHFSSPSSSPPHHPLPQPVISSFPQPSFPEPYFPQPSFPQPSFPQPSLPQPSFPQPSIPQLTGGSSESNSGLDNVHATKMSQTRVEDTSTLQANHINVDAAVIKVIQHLYKNQLQSYAQKNGLGMPVYSCEREGPPHACRFKSKVVIDGTTYECSDFYSTLKDAEHAAAKVALLSLFPDGAQEEDTAMYKNLLQEMAQRKGYKLPVYTTHRSGEAHVPTFISTVEVEGKVFTGQEAKTKKLADMSAAKVAYSILKECYGVPNQSSSAPSPAYCEQPPKFLSSSVQPYVMASLPPNSSSKASIILSPKPSIKIQAKDNQDMGVGLRTTGAGNEPRQEEHLGEKFDLTHHCLATSSPADVTTICSSNSSSFIPRNDHVADASMSKDQPLPSPSPSPSPSPLPSSNYCNNAAEDSKDMLSTSQSTSSRKKVSVYARKANVSTPQGGILLPESDDNWAAYAYPE